ncbi:MAG TPA: hypothetical protein VEH27_11540 [Methylomirabilota bacterium]|nr:hypothetical protein [Methylomirabilota bacterium]
MEDSVNFKEGLEVAWVNFMTFLPKALMFAIILVAGYYLAKLLAKLLDRALERIGFDNMVERGGIKKALARSKYDASDLLSKLLFYTAFLFVLQLAFGVFGHNPVSDLLTRMVAFLPSLFVAVIIVIIASAIGAGVRDILKSTLGGMSYGNFLANAASTAIIVLGVFAALSHVGIAPAIVNGLFYGLLAVVCGSAIIAIGGGGIAPMRAEWERALGKVRKEAPRVAEQAASKGPQTVQAKVQEWKELATHPADGGGNAPGRIITP